MSEEQQVVLILKGLITQMTEDQRARYQVAYDEIKAIIAKGDPERMALIMHGAELNAQ